MRHAPAAVWVNIVQQTHTSWQAAQWHASMHAHAIFGCFAPPTCLACSIEFGTIMVWYFIADRTSFIPAGEKVRAFSHTADLGLCLGLLAGCCILCSQVLSNNYHMAQSSAGNLACHLQQHACRCAADPELSSTDCARSTPLFEPVCGTLTCTVLSRTVERCAALRP